MVKKKENVFSKIRSSYSGELVIQVSDACILELRERGKLRAGTNSGIRELQIIRCTPVYGAHESGAAGRFF